MSHLARIDKLRWATNGHMSTAAGKPGGKPQKQGGGPIATQLPPGALREKRTGANL